MNINLKWQDFTWNPYSEKLLEFNKGKNVFSSINRFEELQIDEEKLKYPFLIKDSKKILINPDIDLFDSEMLKYDKLNILKKILDLVRSNSHHQFMMITTYINDSIFETFDFPSNIIITLYADDSEWGNWQIGNIYSLDTTNFSGQFYLFFNECATTIDFISLKAFDKVIISLDDLNGLTHWSLNWINSILSQSIQDGCIFSLDTEPESIKGSSHD